MYLCYIDESGTPEVPGTTSHFVLAGIAVPIADWRRADQEIGTILGRYGLGDAELHTAWLLRPYVEQVRIGGFDRLSKTERRSAVNRERAANLLRLHRSQNRKSYQQTKKNYLHTDPYVHLTFDERRALVREVADCVAGWEYAKLFAECIDKTHFDTNRTGRSIGEQAFEQVVSRFEQFLSNTRGGRPDNFGLLVHDNNQTVARKHTSFMREFHAKGTLWTQIQWIIETPLFVESSLTRMVQVADLCSYGLRRYIENGEEDLFRRLFRRADRIGGVVVGVRHFSNIGCTCEICVAHRRL